MSIIPPIGAGEVSTGFYNGVATQSLRFEDGDSSYLLRTPGSASNTRIFTISMWVKRGNLSSNQNLMNVFVSASPNNQGVLRFNSSDQLQFTNFSGEYDLVTNKLFRDTTNWYHIVVSVDTTRSTASHRVRIYINGEEQTSLATSTYPNQILALEWNTANKHLIGARTDNSTPTPIQRFDGYLAEVNMIDGHALKPEALGEDKNGTWIPKAYGIKTTQIAQGTGTAIGDMTSGGGLAGAFNGTLFQEYGDSAQQTASNSTSFIGKNWGSSKSITGFALYSNINFGFVGSLASTFTVKLYGKNGAPSNSTDGTLLFTSSAVTDANSRGGIRYFADTNIHSEETISSFTTTAFTYHWVVVTPSQNEGAYVSEIEFYEDASTYYGANSFRLTFEATGTGTTAESTNNAANMTNIGDDKSGQGHNFSRSGLSSHDSNLPDSPENNFCTLNPLDKSAGTFSEGNLRYDTSTWDMATGTFLLPSGKWYYEVRVDESVSAKAFSVGIIEASRRRVSGNSYYWSASGWSTSSQGYLYGVNVNGTTEYKISAGSATSLSSHPDIVQGSVIGIFIDLESATTSIKYNVDGGTPFELFTSMQDVDYTVGVSDYQVQLTFNFGQDSTFVGQETAGGNTDANGKGNFHTALPSGHTDYLAICSANLPELTIGPDSSTQANNYFDVGLYQSTGGASDSSAQAPTLNFTDFAFRPDWVIIKGRSYTDWGMTFDSARGPGKTLQAFRDYTEGDYANTLTSFDANGFTLGADSTVQVNWRQNTYVTHGWKAGGAPTASNSESAGATPTAGSVKIDGSNLGSALAGTIAATEITANTTSGFSVVLYTGTGSAATVAHGLSSAPEFILVMGRNVSNSQMVGLTAYNGWTHYVALKNAGYSVDDNTQWNDTAPTSSVFSVGTAANTNQSTKTYVAYCMHSVEGFSKIGIYIGNNSTDGAFVYTGFRPAFVVVKLVSTGGEDFIYWDYKRDPDNLVHNKMYWNANNSEITDTTNRMMDFLSNGFKHRTDHVSTNGNGGTYMYMAFAEQPFKFSNAR